MCGQVDGRSRPAPTAEPRAPGSPRLRRARRAAPPKPAAAMQPHRALFPRLDQPSPHLCDQPGAACLPGQLHSAGGPAAWEVSTSRSPPSPNPPVLL